MRPDSLLCVANFPSNTGYAWNFIEGLYAGVADRLATGGTRTWVAYPYVGAPPESLRGSAATPVELDVRLDSAPAMRALLSFIRRESVRTIYLTDRPAWHPGYALLRLAGVRRIVVHDHTSGERTRPAGAKRMLKRLSRRLPWMTADVVVGVSDFVVRRKLEVDLIPPGRVRRIWNSLVIPAPTPDAGQRLRETFDLSADRPVVCCACRAAREKGVQDLILAFDQVLASWPSSAPRPALVYMGDGPYLSTLRELRAELDSRADIVFAGYRADATELLAGADLCVVPSIWQEAFGLAVLEPMARGVPVIATTVGGIPEVALHEETGLLVPPGDVEAIAAAMERLLGSPGLRRTLGESGRRRAIAHFSLDDEIDALTELLQPGSPAAVAQRVHEPRPSPAPERIEA